MRLGCRILPPEGAGVGTGAFRGDLLNLSRAGALAEVDLPPALSLTSLATPGRERVLRIETQGDAGPLSLAARVVWSRRQGGRMLVGLHFLAMAGGSRKTLEELLDRAGVGLQARIAEHLESHDAAWRPLRHKAHAAMILVAAVLLGLSVAF